MRSTPKAHPSNDFFVALFLHTNQNVNRVFSVTAEEPENWKQDNSPCAIAPGKFLPRQLPLRQLAPRTIAPRTIDT